MPEAPSRFDRAAAMWVARYLREVTSTILPFDEDIRNVDFDTDGGYHYSSYTFGEDEAVLRYERRTHASWTWEYLTLEGIITPGKFIEGCVALLAELPDA